MLVAETDLVLVERETSVEWMALEAVVAAESPDPLARAEILLETVEVVSGREVTPSQMLVATDADRTKERSVAASSRILLEATDVAIKGGT